MDDQQTENRRRIDPQRERWETMKMIGNEYDTRAVNSDDRSRRTLTSVDNGTSQLIHSQQQSALPVSSGIQSNLKGIQLETTREGRKGEEDESIAPYAQVGVRGYNRHTYVLNECVASIAIQFPRFVNENGRWSVNMVGTAQHRKTKKERKRCNRDSEPDWLVGIR